MDTRFLKSLISVINEGSIAAAALRDGITASAVSQRLKTLEDTLGVKLLIRSGRNVRPTPACTALMPQILRVVNEAQALAMANPLNVAQGHLKIGAIATVLADDMPQIIRTITAEFPQIELSIHPGTSRELYNQFQDGELDLVLSVVPPFTLPKAQQMIPLGRHPIGVLSVAERIPENAPLIVYQREAWGGAPCWEIAHKLTGVHPVLCELDALETIAIMVRGGLGISVVPYWDGLAKRFADLCFRPVENLQRDFGLILHSHQIDHPVAKLIAAYFGNKTSL